MKDIITSTSNPRVVEARKLTHKKHRHRTDRFAAEGLQVLRMAIEGMACPRMAGHIRPIDVFFCEYLFTTDRNCTYPPTKDRSSSWYSIDRNTREMSVH